MNTPHTPPAPHAGAAVGIDVGWYDVTIAHLPVSSVSLERWKKRQAA